MKSFRLLLSQMKFNFVELIDKAVIYSYLNNIASLVFGTTTYFLIIKILDRNELSSYYFYSSIFLFINLVVASISPNVSRFTNYIYKNIEFLSAEGKTSTEKTDSLLNSLYKLVVNINFISLFAFLFLGVYIFSFNGLNAIVFDFAEYLLFCFAMILYVSLSFSSSVLRGFNEVQNEQVNNLIANIFKGLVGVVVLFVAKSVLFFALSLIFFIVILSVLSNISLQKKYNFYFFGLRTYDKISDKEINALLKKTSFKIFLGSIGNYFFSGLFILLILNQSANTSYHSCLVYIQLYSIIVGVSSILFYRNQINLIGDKHDSELYLLFMNVFKKSTFLYFIIVLVSIIVFPYILNIAGKNEMILSISDVVLLSIIYYLELIMIGLSLSLSGRNSLNYQISYLISGIVFIVLIYLELKLNLNLSVILVTRIIIFLALLVYPSFRSLKNLNIPKIDV